MTTPMTWVRTTIFPRLICFVFGLAGLGFAWRLTLLGASGAEDIPPPFTLVAGLVGIALLCVAVVGRYPRSASK